jgi:undecaprenyl-diphosphatase
MPYLEEQLNFIRSIQTIRGPYMDLLFRFLNYFDSEYFVFLLVPIIWLGFSWRWGARVFFLMIISSYVNSYLKEVFGLPRPFHVDPSLAVVIVKGFGLPSGGAQNAMLLGSLLIAYWKKPAAWAIGLFYILLISFSRLYLGVHFPLDVLSGWTIGLVLLFLFIYLHKPIERTLSSKPGLAIAASIAIPLIAMLAFPKFKIYYIMTTALIGGIGIVISYRLHLFLKKPTSISEGVIRALIGTGGVFGLYFLSRWIFSQIVPPTLVLFFPGTFITLWISLAASPFCSLIFHRKKGS